MLLEQILKELKTKYKDLGLGDDYLKVTAKRLARTVKEESEISDAVADLEEEMKFQQSQNDTLRTLKNQVKKFEEGGKNQEGKGEEKEPKQETEEKKPTEDVPVWAKALIDSNKALSEKLETLEKEKISQSNEQKLISKLKELGVNENFYTLQIEGKTFQNDEEIDAFANVIKEKEISFFQSISNEKLGNVTPPIMGSETVEGQVSADVQAFVGTFKKD